MYTNTKIDTENAKVIRAPLDTEFWISKHYYTILSEATYIKPIAYQVGTEQNPVYGIPATYIPGDYDYYRQNGDWDDTGTPYDKDVINGEQLTVIAQSRGWNIWAENDDFITKFERYQTEWMHPPYTEVTGQYKQQSLSYNVSLGYPAEIRQKQLKLVLRDWTETTEIQIRLMRSSTELLRKTYSGKDLNINTITIDLSFLPDTTGYGVSAYFAITDRVDWDSPRTNDKAWFKVGAFTTDYVYYVNQKSLVSSDVSLRSDLKVNASTLPTSQINVTSYAPEETFKAFQAAYVNDVFFYYVSGYLDDLDLSYGSTGSTKNNNFPVMSRRFFINEPLKFEYPNKMTIEAEDMIHQLYNGDFDCLTYHNRLVTMFTDKDPFEDEYGAQTFTSLANLNVEMDAIRTNWPDANGIITRYKFIFWAMIYAYFKTLYKNNPTWAKHFLNIVFSKYKDFFYNDNNYSEYQNTGTIYEEGSAYGYDINSVVDFKYLCVLENKAPLPLMAWIQDAWHGLTDIKDKNGTWHYDLPFYPRYVDAGRPDFEYEQPQPVITINESDMASINKTIETPIKFLVVPKNYKIARHTQFAYTTSSYKFPDTKKRLLSLCEHYSEYTKEDTYGWFETYNYQGGLRYRNMITFQGETYGDDNPKEIYFGASEAYNGSYTTVHMGLLHKKLRFDIDSAQSGQSIMPSNPGITWQIYGKPLDVVQNSTTLTNTNLLDGATVEVSYENYMGRILDESLIRQSMLNRSNITMQFTWRGDPRLQPRDVFTLNKLDGTTVNCTVENISTKHENGGTTQTITYREGII